MSEDYVEFTADNLSHRWRNRTVLEFVDEAVSNADSTEEYATPESALRWLLELAWSGLELARREALNERWSIRCDHEVCRIIGITRLIGPLPWEHIPVDLILDGIYERIHAGIGVPTPLSDDNRQRAREVKERNAGTYEH
jgi:hypothetical protein